MVGRGGGRGGDHADAAEADEKQNEDGDVMHGELEVRKVARGEKRIWLVSDAESCTLMLL